MASGYKVIWTDHALKGLKNTVSYLEKNWTEKELRNFSHNLEHTIELISKSPELFQMSKEKKGVRRAVIMKYNSLYYRVIDRRVEILTFFSNRQNPKKNRI